MRGEDIHIGDVLVIKSMDEMIADGGKYDCNGGIDLPDGFYFNKHMEYLCGRIISVSNVLTKDRENLIWIIVPEEEELLRDWELSAAMLKPDSPPIEIEAFKNNELDELLNF